ncbi:MAG TPA: hypothetical protein VK154_14515 [Chitinophagales bacterium]|nr:hypothetical protein [Chitinophagales bacterium]
MKYWLILIVFTQGCSPSQSGSAEDRFKYFSLEDPMEKAWLEKDTAFYINRIDSLKYFDFPKLAHEANNLSIVTGFGWALIDPYDAEYQRKDTDSSFFKENIIAGFEAYKESEMFMRDIPNIILMHRYSHYDAHMKISETDSLDVARFLEDVANNNFSLSSNKR